MLVVERGRCERGSLGGMDAGESGHGRPSRRLSERCRERKRTVDPSASPVVAQCDSEAGTDSSRAKYAEGHADQLVCATDEAG